MLQSGLWLIGVWIRWVQGDALQLPFPDNHFDAVTMGYGLRNVVSIPHALQEIQRVLKYSEPDALHKKPCLVPNNQILTVWQFYFYFTQISRKRLPFVSSHFMQAPLKISESLFLGRWDITLQQNLQGKPRYMCHVVIIYRSTHDAHHHHVISNLSRS